MGLERHGMKDGDDGVADGQITHGKDVVDGAANDKHPR